MTQLASTADSTEIIISLRNPNENDLVCQGRLTRGDLQISGTGSSE